MPGPYEVVWTKVAAEDLTAIIKYIQSDNPVAANDSLQRIKAKALNLDSLPERGRIVPELRQQGILQFRELIVPPWRIMYRISDNFVYVLAIFDSRQNIEDVLLDRMVR